MTTARSTLVDLSHVITAGMVTYPGLPGPVIEDHMSYQASRPRYAPGTQFQIGRISLVANTGTYVDVPSHRFEGAADLAQSPLDRFVDLEGLALSTADRAIGPELFGDVDVAGRAVLIRTGWSQHWGTDRYAAQDHPFLSAAAVDWLVARGPSIVGIDSVNIDDMADLTRPAHTGLLRAGIPVVEHMTGLDQVVGARFRFHAAPLAVAGMGTFSVRAYALVDEQEGH